MNKNSLTNDRALAWESYSASVQVLLAADEDVMKSSIVSSTDAWAAMEAAFATTGATPALQFFTCARYAWRGGCL